MRSFFSRRSKTSLPSAAPQEVASGKDGSAMSAAEPQHNNVPPTTPTGQLLRPLNRKKLGPGKKQPQKVDTSSAPSCGGPHTTRRNRSSPLSGRRAADSESKIATGSSWDGTKTSSEDTGGLDESTVTTISTATTDTQSRASSGASSDSLGQADDATVERHASPASGAPSAAGKLNNSTLAPTGTSADDTTVITAPKVEGSAATPLTWRQRYNQMLDVWYNQIAKSPEPVTAVRTGAAPLTSDALPSLLDTAGGPKLNEGPMANPSSSDDFNNSTELPQDSTSTFRADVPLKRPLLERLRGCISVKRLFRLRKGARMNPIQLASDVVALSAQAGTTGRTTSMELSLRALSTQASTSHPQALNPTDLCEGITHQTHELATLVAALEKAMDQLQVLKKAQEKSAHDEVLRVMCELVGEKQARQLAAAEAENYRRRMKKAETEMGRLRARREEAEEALEGLRARHEELEKTHATTLQAHAAQCNVTVGLLTEVQARRVEAMEQKAVGRQLEKARRGLKAKDVHLKTLKQERDATLTQVEVSEAKHSEKTQRLSKALQHGQERVRELQAKEQRQAGRLETLQGSLVSAQGLVAQYQQRLQAAQALAREEAQRADEAEALVEEERRRAEEAKAEAQEERRRAEEAAAQVVTETRRANVAEAQNMAKSQELQEADAYAAQLQASLNEAQGRQGEAAQIEALQAQIAQLTMQLQQAQALVGQRDAQLAQAQGEVDRGEGRLMDTALAARRCQAAEVLVNAAEYAGLFDQLEAMGIAVVGHSQRRNKHFNRLYGVKAGSPSVPVTIRLYLSMHAELAEGAAGDLLDRQEQLGLSDVMCFAAGDEGGIHVVVIVGMDSHHDVENEDEEEDEEDEEEEEGSEGGSVHGEGTQGASQASAQEASQEGGEQGEGGQGGAVPPTVPRTPNHYHLGKTEVFQVQEGQEGYDDAQPIQQAMATSDRKGILGAGAFGQVHWFVDEDSDQKFCLKFQLVKDSTTRQCAVIERRLGQKLRDAEHCVTFEAAWIGLRYSVGRMPFLEGSTTLQRAKEEGFFAEGPFLSFRLESVMRQLLAAVRELQDMEVAHRDIKATNALIIKDRDDPNIFSIKLIDFGCATDDCHNTPVQCSGTAPFMPIENVVPGYNANMTQGVYGDLYAVAETLFRLIPRERSAGALADIPTAQRYVLEYPGLCAAYMGKCNRASIAPLSMDDHADQVQLYTYYPRTVARALSNLTTDGAEVINVCTAKAIAIGLSFEREKRLPMIETAWDDLADLEWEL